MATTLEQPTTSLESTIRTGLTAPNIKAATVEKILADVRARISTVAAQAQASHVAATDPLGSIEDARSALTAARDAEFEHGRLSIAEQQLAARVNKLKAAEARAASVDRYDAVKARRDEAKVAFDEIPALFARLKEIIDLGEASDREVAELNARASAETYILPAEVLSRGCEGNYRWPDSLGGDGVVRLRGLHLPNWRDGRGSVHKPVRS